MIKDWLEYIKTGWHLFAMTATWLLTIGASFIVNPPLRDYSEDDQTVSITKFLIAAITALIFIPAKIWSKKKHYKIWYVFSVLLLLGVIACFFIYAGLLDSRSVKYYDARLVIGNNMLPKMALRRDSMQRSTREIIIQKKIVELAAGKTSSIWPQAEINRNYYLLSSIYILNITLVGLFIITILQSIRCYENSKTKKNSIEPGGS
jgi:hypothetical protein